VRIEAEGIEEGGASDHERLAEPDHRERQLLGLGKLTGFVPAEPERAACGVHREGDGERYQFAV
jgi:hypothetical protein